MSGKVSYRVYADENGYQWSCRTTGCYESSSAGFSTRDKADKSATQHVNVRHLNQDQR